MQPGHLGSSARRECIHIRIFLATRTPSSKTLSTDPESLLNTVMALACFFVLYGDTSSDSSVIFDEEPSVIFSELRQFL
jgi:hypothetical protein